MDENLIFKNLNLSNEDKIVFEKIIDDINECIKTKENKFTHFLDPYEISIFKEIFFKYKFDINYKIFGGFSNTKRNILGFYYNDLKEGDFPIEGIKIEYNSRFSKSLTHRDFSESMTGIGLNGNVIGDILVKENHAIVIVNSNIVSSLKSNLKEICSLNVIVKKVDLNSVYETYDKKNSNSNNGIVESESQKDMTWSYQAQELWDSICDESQSPIDIDTSKVQAMTDIGIIELNYNNDDSDKIVDTGNRIEVVKGGSAIINGRNFNLLQYHFHSHSEHTTDGKNYPLEVHFVHNSESGRLAVIGVFLIEGKENEIINKILNNFRSDKIVELEKSFDVSSLFPKNKSYYHYLGSLTTPPIVENVEWYIMKNPVEISRKQIDALRKIYDGNNRAIQPLNDRNVLIYEEQ